MRLLPFRRKDKDKKKSDAVDDFLPPSARFRSEAPIFPPTYHSTQLLSHLPAHVLQRIFIFVCPHAYDESYETCEQSASDGGCMLCDLRDLSSCGRVNRAWRKNSVPIL
jgi:hypothetical protein